MKTKKELRATISARKKECCMQLKRQKSAEIFEKLKNNERFRSAGTVLCYWSMPDEVHTHDFVAGAAGGKRLLLPVVSGDDLLIREFTGLSGMVEGEAFAIPEPDCNSKEVGIEEIDLVIVPGVAFDAGGGRMGRGKGYYDRLLRGCGAYKIGVCFDFQIVDDVPKDEHDVPMDEIISA